MDKEFSFCIANCGNVGYKLRVFQNCALNAMINNTTICLQKKTKKQPTIEGQPIKTTYSG